MTTATTNWDVIVVGGGPAGCSAGVFTARYGLETLVFDRGRSSLKHCAFLENFLGFPAGIDIETFYELMHDHAVEVGCELVPELVESVERTDTGFVVETQDGTSVETSRVVAASKYDAEYLRPLGTSVMFEEGEFDAAYPDDDGTTPIDGLYVAGPLAGVGDQTLVAAGHGATVGRSLIADVRREHGYWEDLTEHTDWVRRESELPDEWADRERWVEWFDGRVPDEVRDTERIERIRESVIDRKRDAYVSDSDIERRTERGHQRLAAYLDDEAILDAVDDGVIREYLDNSIETPSDDD